MVTQPRWLRSLALAAATCLLSALVTVPAVAASADTRPASGTPATVSTDVLPTVQVDGVVWTQVIIGNTVFAGGQFANARPAGAAAGSQNTTRSNLLAYDLTTGMLRTSFAPSLNAQVRGLAASPDGRTLYAVGDFTTVDGVAKSHVVALDPTTGAVQAGFTAKTNAATYAVAATATTVYLGGTFTSVDGVTRPKAGAVDAASGALKAWAPTVPDNVVRALVVSPDGAKVVLGGSFTSLNGSTSPGSGLGAVDAVTGASTAWNVGKLIYNHGTKSAIFSLASDGTSVYGTGYVYGSLADGNLEGTFNASWSDGTIKWIEDCHGDSYSVAPTDDAVYVVSHAHYCGNLPGGHPQTDPWHFQRALAYTKTTTGVLGKDPYGYYDFEGQPAPTQLAWYPDVKSGTVTGQYQGAWSVAAGSGYVVLGGEFPSVDGVAQAGLVRFATSAIAPDKDGPRLAGDAWTPSVQSPATGVARLTWPANYDRDNAELTYTVYRDGGSTPIANRKVTSHDWWDRPVSGLTDKGLTPGATVSYRIVASDPFGNTASSATVRTVVASTGTLGAYASAVLDDGAADYWRLGEASGSKVADWSGTNDMTASSGVTRGTGGAIAGDADTASTFSGDSSGLAAASTQIAGPNTFSIEAWFKTTTQSGGKIVGFGNANTGDSTSYDRHVYMDTDGHVVFGVYPGSVQTVQTTDSYNDGKWHAVVASLSPSGMQLSLDGKRVASRADVTTAQTYDGYWRIGGDSAWSGAPYFAGSIDDVAIYPTALTDAQVAGHYASATGAVVNRAPTASFTQTSTGLATSFDASASRDSDGSIAAYRWDFGDGSTGSGVKPSHTYAKAGTYTVGLTVTDDGGTTGATTSQVQVAAVNQAPTAAFTAASTALNASFDASASSDDGSIADYAWDFGDGTTGSGRTATHGYTKAGQYTVRLTVTDDAGATDTATRTVTVAAAQSQTVASDAFGRTVASGLGTADVGGAWSVPSAASSWSVTSGAASVSTAAGSTRSAYLADTSSDSVDLSATVSAASLPAGGSSYIGVVARRIGSTDYNARILVGPTGAVTVQVLRDGTALKSATVGGLTVSAGTALRLRVQATGTSPTTLQAKVWKASDAEPSGWQVSTTDTTDALQGKGSIGLRTYTGGGVTNGPLVTTFDDLKAVVAG